MAIQRYQVLIPGTVNITLEGKGVFADVRKNCHCHYHHHRYPGLSRIYPFANSDKSYQKCCYKRGTGRWHVQRRRKQSDTAETGVMPPEQGDADGHRQPEETKDGVAPRAFLEGGPASTLISVQWTDIKFLASRTMRAIPVALSNQVCGHLWQPQETHAVIIPVSQMGKMRLRKDNSLRS